MNSTIVPYIDTYNGIPNTNTYFVRIVVYKIYTHIYNSLNNL